MEWPLLRKTPHSRSKTPNLLDYQQSYELFTWKRAEEILDGLPDGRGLNSAHEAVDRHAMGAKRDHVALRWLGKDGTTLDLSYADLAAQSNRFANVLQELGIDRGDRVFILSSRIPALYIAALGTLKNRSVVCPLFSAFGPEPIHQRMSLGDGKILVTTKRLYKRKIAAIRDELPQLQVILLADVDEDLCDDVLSLPKRMEAASPLFTIPPTDPEDMALLHFTSGTTGQPKGAIHVHNAVLVHQMSGQYALDLHADDVFWCTADPGWVTGTSYGIIAPLCLGVTMIVDEAEFDAERWFHILEEQKVNVWYTAPTAIRRLMRLDMAPREIFDLSHLRFIASVGEPLNPEAVLWGEKRLALPIHDNWWQTETGGIMIANFAAMDIRPGSMGKPLPGIEAAIARRIEDADGNTIAIEPIQEPNVEGELVLKPGWPSMFRGYLHAEERYRKAFADGWYISGDLAERDQDGYYWFIGRADDIIKTAGHMVGPFEVESALMEHPAVAEAGVIGVPDETIGQIVKAFISLKAPAQPDEALRLELLGFGRKKLGSAVAPKLIEFQQDLPKTRSGKIMRRLLKARDLGLPEGDTSTLETAETKEPQTAEPV